MKDLAERLAALSPEQRALLERRLEERGIAIPKGSAIRPIPGREALEYLPTSLDQERLWFIDQMEPGNAAYNIHTASRLFGPMDPALLARAVNASIARHEVLRTTFSVVDGRPVQVVHRSLEIDLPVVDLSHLEPEERERAAMREAVAAAAVPFDLERGPLVQVRLVRLAPEEHILMMNMHHAITDRWSFDIFENEVASRYRAWLDGETAEFPELPIQFADFAAWQREALAGEELGGHLQYWREKLAGASMVVEMPTDRPRPPVQTFSGAREYIIYPEWVKARLKELTQRSGATMFMTTLAALDLLVWRYTHQRDFVIGSAIADRNRPETEHLIGYFLNMLLLRAEIDPRMSFRELLARVRETAVGAFAHQDVPFAALVNELRPKQDPSRNPLIQISYIYLDFPVLETPEQIGMTSAPLDVDNGASRFDMTLACTELPGEGTHAYIEYNTDLYDGPKVARMLAHLGRILEAVALDPDVTVGEIDLLGDDERRELLVDFNATAHDLGNDLLHGPFERAARRAPERVAVSVGGDELTYGELDARANRLARWLRRGGAGPESAVAICLERSLELPVAMLGVLKSGAAYVPLDPSFPAERLARILDASGARVLLTASGLGDRLPATDARVLELDRSWDEVESESDEPLECVATAESLAYVYFTSGSTGMPKGVMVPHRAIANRLAWAEREFPLREEDAVLMTATFSFDIAVWELLGPLGAGAKVVIPSHDDYRDAARLAVIARDERVTVLHAVPSLLRLLVDEAAFAAAPLRMIFTGGEGVPRGLCERVVERTGARVAEFYGPTEAAISSTCHEFEPGGDGPLPIGRPIANTRVYLVDPSGMPVPRGVPGELLIGGRGLARGYVGRPDLTAERFVPDPFSGEPGARLYRTGDVARFREDGALEFVGRADRQVKLRGFRIEPGEIEAALTRHEEVREAVVVARDDGHGPRLVAYVVPERRAEPDVTDGRSDSGAPESLRSWLRGQLPEYMIPAAFVTLEALPLAPTGKVDRNALPEPGAAPVAAAVEPDGPTEEAIAEIWRATLRLERVGARDDFFEAGGDSLLATQIVSRIRAAFDVDFPLRRFFEDSTVAGLAAIVEELLVEKISEMSDEEAERLLRERELFFEKGE